MSNRLYAPQIRNYIDWLGHIRYRDYNDQTTYDEHSYELLDELFTLLKQIAPVSDYGARELWLHAERGPIEAFGDYQEYLEEEMVSSREEFEELWREYYPEEDVWYYFGSVEDEAINYRAVLLGHKHILEQDARKEKSPFTHDVSELLEWLIASVKESIADLEAGTYNERIARELPPQHRTGTIRRRDWWNAFPESREDFFADISPEEVQEFVNLTQAQAKDLEKSEDRCPEMTVNDFLNCCAIGYQACGYDGCELTPREQYHKHADGRDEGLMEVDPDSSEAFIEWYHGKHFGGHPWEICRGGNSTHIDLYVLHDENGFALLVAGSAWTRTIEAVKIYLALKNAGWPVYIRDADMLAARLLEEERIGIVPEGVTPAYCQSSFPGEDVIDFKNLPYENRDMLAGKCTWQPIRKIELISTLSE